MLADSSSKILCALLLTLAIAGTDATDEVSKQCSFASSNLSPIAKILSCTKRIIEKETDFRTSPMSADDERKEANCAALKAAIKAYLVPVKTTERGNGFHRSFHNIVTETSGILNPYCKYLKTPIKSRKAPYYTDKLFTIQNIDTNIVTQAGHVFPRRVDMRPADDTARTLYADYACFLVVRSSIAALRVAASAPKTPKTQGDQATLEQVINPKYMTAERAIKALDNITKALSTATEAAAKPNKAIAIDPIPVHLNSMAEVRGRRNLFWAVAAPVRDGFVFSSRYEDKSRDQLRRIVHDFVGKSRRHTNFKRAFAIQGEVQKLNSKH